MKRKQDPLKMSSSWEETRINAENHEKRRVLKNLAANADKISVHFQLEQSSNTHSCTLKEIFRAICSHNQKVHWKKKKEKLNAQSIDDN